MKICYKFIVDGKEKWYTGKIIRAVGDGRNEDCEFEVSYIDGDDFIVQVYKEP